MTYFPFVHEKKKEPEYQPTPLQIEIDPPKSIPIKKEESEKEERGVIIIELF